jgi:hypothetical protein
MNCAECRDMLAACAEGLLTRDESLECHRHLESCAECAAEYQAVTSLQRRLVARGQLAAEVSLVPSVMRRVQQHQKAKETIMSKILRHRWGFGLGAAIGAAAAIVLLLVLSTPNAHARAEEILARGARAIAKITSIHLRGQVRAYPADNFGGISPDSPFCSIELWKQWSPELKWRVEKPGRVCLMDGQCTLMFIKPNSTAVKFPKSSTSAFDTDWLQRIANLSNAITNELKNALALGWKLSVTEETGADGRAKSVVTVMAKSGVPEDDYCKNTFMDNADTRRVYRFDAQTELLEAVQVYLVRTSGEVQIFELSQIDYDQSIAPEVWHIELPADVSWAQLPQDIPKLPDNEKYASMTSEQAARAFFEACGREDWTEAGKFFSPINDRLKQYLGGLEVISIGESFTSKGATGRFVPYEIKLRPQEFDLRVSNDNPAKRYVITGLFGTNLALQQDLTWSNAPVTLPNNDLYAGLSPVEAVKAYFDASAKLDWDEMGKFAPDYDVQNDKAQIEAAQKQGVDVMRMLPKREAVEAFWSPEKSCWFVKCRAMQVKKWNLGVRKDNAAHRWQVGGGI